MTAVASPMYHDRRVIHRHLRVVRPAGWGGTQPARDERLREEPCDREVVRVARRPSRSVYRRRRIAVAVLAVVTLLAARMLLGGLGGGSLASPEPAPPVLIGQSSYVVQPGDTLWSVARSLQPQADPRPLVDRLAAHRHGAPLRVGERLAL